MDDEMKAHLALPPEQQKLPWRSFSDAEWEAINWDSEQYDKGCDRPTLIRLTYTISALRMQLGKEP